MGTRHVEAIRQLGDRLEMVISHMGIDITLPPLNDKAQKIHRVLGSHGPTPANAGGFATHPGKSNRTGINYKM